MDNMTMKAFTIVMVVIFNYAQLVPAMSISEPIWTSLMTTLNPDEIPNDSMCPNGYKEIENIKSQAGRLWNNLVPIITQKLPNPHSVDGLENVITQHCTNNEDLNKIAKSLSKIVKNCLSDRTDFNTEKLDKLKSDVVSRICGVTSAMITWNIMNLNIAEGRNPDGKL